MLGTTIVMIALSRALDVHTCNDIARDHQDMMIRSFGRDVFNTDTSNVLRGRNQRISDLNAQILQSCTESLLAQ